mmetsp:Transcript_58257/g.169102  ORF Transcript_58257/g.169102 Transcript_58257/m.169102 type:complete len:234 (+) Transcript_58257:218-919(+)
MAARCRKNKSGDGNCGAWPPFTTSSDGPAARTQATAGADAAATRRKPPPATGVMPPQPRWTRRRALGTAPATTPSQSWTRIRAPMLAPWRMCRRATAARRRSRSRWTKEDSPWTMTLSTLSSRGIMLPSARTVCDTSQGPDGRTSAHLQDARPLDQRLVSLAVIMYISARWTVPTGLVRERHRRWPRETTTKPVRGRGLGAKADHADRLMPPHARCSLPRFARGGVHALARVP